MKRFIALLLCTALTVCLSIMPANAATNSGRSGSMTVNYSMTSSYLIVLPDLTYTESGSNEFEIKAQYVHLAEGKTLTVAVDAASTLKTGKFYISGLSGGKLCDMECKILVSNADETATSTDHYISDTDTTLAVFAPETIKAKSYGKITLQPQVTSSTPVANYSGTIYYTIKIQ